MVLPTDLFQLPKPKRIYMQATQEQLDCYVSAWIQQAYDERRIKKLGSGKDGDVYLVEAIDSCVAVKVLRERQNLGSFENNSEVSTNQLIAGLLIEKRQFFVGCLGAATTSAEEALLFFEYCNEGTLQQTLPEIHSSKLSIEMRLEQYILPIANALAVLDSYDIQHCDVSIDNVLLHDGVARLADMGMAVVVGDDSHTNTGKLLLRPPEGKTVSTKTNVWQLALYILDVLDVSLDLGLGRVKASLACGKDALAEMQHEQWCLSYQESTVREALRTTLLPEYLQTLLVKMLERDPVNRISTQDVVDILKARCVKVADGPIESVNGFSTFASQPADEHKDAAASVKVLVSS